MSVKRLFSFAVMVWAFQSCDYVDPRNFREGSQVQVTKWDMDTSYLLQDSIQPQMVLLEEYTGQFCGNCPGAARTAKKLDSIYADRLHIMAIHAGYFAEPENNPLRNDFRCEAGDYLDTKFNLVSQSVPKGLINRGRFGASQIAKLNPTSWQSKIEELASKPATDLTLYLHPYYDAPSNQFFAVSRLKFRKQVTDSILVSLYLLEDSIINWQLDYGSSPSEVSEYAHRHVLRGAFTPVGGSETAGLPPFLPGKVSTGRWVLDRRDGINRKNCYVVAIAYRQDTDEIIQAVEVKVGEK
jgi:hypothetical protein